MSLNNYCIHYKCKLLLFTGKPDLTEEIFYVVLMIKFLQLKTNVIDIFDIISLLSYSQNGLYCTVLLLVYYKNSCY